MEACKEAGWKARGSKIKCKSQIKWLHQECEAEKENLQSLREEISHNINNSALRQLLQDKKKTFNQTCTQKKQESFSGRGVHINRYIVFTNRGTPITKECVSQVGDHIYLGICVSQLGEHIITRDMCFPRWETHITRDMCFPRWGNTYH